MPRRPVGSREEPSHPDPISPPGQARAFYFLQGEPSSGGMTRQTGAMIPHPVLTVEFKFKFLRGADPLGPGDARGRVTMRAQAQMVSGLAQLQILSN